jgi:hypothetical protein
VHTGLTACQNVPKNAFLKKSAYPEPKEIKKKRLKGFFKTIVNDIFL